MTLSIPILCHRSIVDNELMTQAFISGPDLFCWSMRNLR